MHQERENTEWNIPVFLLWVGHRRASLKGTRIPASVRGTTGVLRESPLQWTPPLARRASMC